jgi:hypothetical protein
MPGLLVEMGILLTFLCRLALNHHPLDLCLPSRWDYRCMSAGAALSSLFVVMLLCISMLANWFRLRYPPWIRFAITFPFTSQFWEQGYLVTESLGDWGGILLLLHKAIILTGKTDSPPEANVLFHEPGFSKLGLISLHIDSSKGSYFW